MDYNNNKNRDEEKVFSVTMTEEELKLFSEFLSYQKGFSEGKEKEDKDEDDDLYLSDKVSIWADKNLKSKSGRNSAIRRFDRDILDPSKHHKRVAATLGGLYAVPGAIAGSAVSGRPIRGAALGGAAGMAIGSGLGYLSSVIDEKTGLNDAKFRKNNPDIDRSFQKKADRNKVADGQMSRSEFSKKYGKKAEEKWIRDSEEGN